MNRCSKGDIQDAVCLFYFVGEIQLRTEIHIHFQICCRDDCSKKHGVLEDFPFLGFFFWLIGWLLGFLKAKKPNPSSFSFL